MKRKIVAMFLSLCMCTAPFAAYAQETETEAPATEAASAASTTAEELMAAMQEFSKNTQSTSAKMTMNMDAALNMGIKDAADVSQNIPITMKGDFDIKMITEPMQMALTGTYTVSTIGVNEEIGMEMYMLTSEDEMTSDTYMKIAAGEETSGWVHQQVDMSEMLEQFGVSSMEELQGQDFESMLPEGVTLDWNVEETDDSYVLGATLAFSEMLPFIESMLSSTGETLGEDELAIVETILSCLNAKFSYTLDKETKAAKTMHLDMNDTDLSAFDELVTELVASTLSSENSEVVECKLVLNDFSLDASYTYDDVTEISVPADALAAPATDVTDSLNSVESVLEETATEAE